MEGSNSTSNNSSRSGLSISSVTENNGGGSNSSQGGWFIDSHNGNIKEQYHFIEKLASGGFGVVYLAEHRKTSKNSTHSLGGIDKSFAFLVNKLLINYDLNI